MGAGFVSTTSHDPAASKPVATQVRPFDSVTSAAFQVMVLADASSNNLVAARSYAGGNPLAVQLTDLAGAPLYSHSVHITNVPAVSQSGAWTVVFSGTPTVVASIPGQQFTTTSIAGQVPVTQATSPWITRPGSSGDFTGFGVSSVPGVVQVSGTVTAYQGGPWVASVWLANTPSVVVANSLAVGVYQVSSPFIVQVASRPVQTASVWVVNTPTVVIANSLGAAVTQVTSPWIVQVASTMGGGNTVTGSLWVANTPTVNVLQVSSPWIVQVASMPPGGSTITGSVAASQAGVWTVGVSGSIVGSVAATQAGAWSVGVSGTVVGSMLASQGGAPWSITGSVLATGSLHVTAVGSVFASQAGAPWSVIGSVFATGSLHATVVGSVAASQAGAWSVGVSGTVVGSVLASQGGAPWTVIGSVGVTQVTSPWVTFQGSTGAFQGFTVTSVIGQPTVTASIAGNIPVTQVTSPWAVFVGSTGQFQGFTVTSVIGQPTVVASLIGQPTATVSLAGTALITGSLFATMGPTAPTFTWQKIAWEVRSTLPFPFDGSAVCRSSGLSTIAFALDVLSSDPTGLAVMIVSSAATRGAVRTVTGWSDQTNRLASVAPNWDTTAPASGNQYVTGIDCRSAETLQLRTEVASAIAGDTRVWLAIGFWAGANSGNTQTGVAPQNRPMPIFDREQSIDAIPVSFHVQVPSYWHAEGVTVRATGHQLAKVYVTSASANFSLWGVAG